MLVTDIGTAEANSYVDVAEADSYLEKRETFNTESWSGLDEDAKELRLFLAAETLDRFFTFRGIRAVTRQRLAFPRIVRGSSLYDLSSEGEKFQKWDDLVEFVTLLGEDPPVIPDEIKYAQIEIAFQIIHSSLLSFDLGESSGMDIRSMSIGGKISVSLGDGKTADTLGLLNRAASDASSIVNLYLSRWVGYRSAVI